MYRKSKYPSARERQEANRECAKRNRKWVTRRRREYKASHPDWIHKGQVPCKDCGQPCKGLRCQSCRTKYKVGEHSSAWKGGQGTRWKDRQGYVRLRKGNRILLEHRVVWEEAHGPTPPNWIIHHLNGISHDNRLENLTAMPKRRHDGLKGASYKKRLKTRIRELENQLSAQ